MTTHQAKLHGGTKDGQNQDVTDSDLANGSITFQHRNLATDLSPHYSAGTEETYKLVRIGDSSAGERVRIVGYRTDQLDLRDTATEDELINAGDTAAEAKVKRMIQRRIDDTLDAAQATRVGPIQWSYEARGESTKVTGTSVALYPTGAAAPLNKPGN